VKIYSNKEFSQLPEFSTKRTSSTRQFQKIVRTSLESVETKSKGVVIKQKASMKKSSSASWKTYVRKGQESCNYSYRLSKTEQLRSGLSPASRLLFVFSIRAQPNLVHFASGAEGALLF